MVNDYSKQVVVYDGRHRGDTTPLSDAGYIDYEVEGEREDNSEYIGSGSESPLNVSDITGGRKTPESILPGGNSDSDCNQRFDEYQFQQNKIQQIIAHHRQYPPQRRKETPEDLPATKERLDYFINCLRIKITQYQNFAEAPIPKELICIPLALSYQTYITLYWPGAFKCCNKLFSAVKDYSEHFYQQHDPPLKPFPETCTTTERPLPAAKKMSATKHRTPTKPAGPVVIVQETSDSSSSSSSNESEMEAAVILSDQEMKKNKNKRVSPVLKKNQEKMNGSTVGDSCRPDSSSSGRKRKTQSPQTSPQAKKVARRLSNGSNNSLVIDTSIDSDEKNASASLNRSNRSKGPGQQDIEDQRDTELERDQLKYPPQHKLTDSYDFIATKKQIDYFKKVLAVKLDKYKDLNCFRPNSPSSKKPLALTLLGFCQHYWPGQVICCGLKRENPADLEKHISRAHRPPKEEPNMIIVPTPNKGVVATATSDEDDNDEEEEENKKEQKERNDPLEIDSDSTSSSIVYCPYENNNSSKNIKNSNSNSKVIITPQAVRENEKPSSSRPGPKSKISIPSGFKEDQHNYPPQHTPEESDDFNANEESLNFFRDAFLLKQTKYSKMSMIKDSPLSYPVSDFVSHYWPGVLKCCGIIISNRIELTKHLNDSHSNANKSKLKLAIAPPIPVRVDPSESESSSVTSSPPPGRFLPLPSSASSSTRHLNGNGNNNKRRKRPSSSPPPPLPPPVAPTAVNKTTRNRSNSNPKPSSLMAERGADPGVRTIVMASVQDEARQLKLQTLRGVSLKDVVSAMDRLLELSLFVTKWMDDLPLEGDQGAPNAETRAPYIELFDFIWQASRTVLIRWDELSKNKSSKQPDDVLEAIKYEFNETLPIAIIWDQVSQWRKNLRVVQHVIKISLMALKNWPFTLPSSTEMELTVTTVKQEPTDDQTKRRRAAAEMAATAMAVSVINNSRRSRNNSSPMKASTGAGPSSSTSFSVSSTSSPAKSSMTVEDWCRLANISINQNTKSRAVNGYRDDDGEQNPMYRYGIAQMIKLYIPPGVKRLRCCDNIFDLAALQVHVQSKHEATARGRTPSTITSAL